MKHNLQSRVQALEARDPMRLRWVFVKQGESRIQARERAGIKDGEPVVYFNWLDTKL